jgi:hypothetical protein
MGIKPWDSPERAYARYCALPERERLPHLFELVRSARVYAVTDWICAIVGVVPLSALGYWMALLIWIVTAGAIAASGTFCWWKARGLLKSICELEAML